jgi:8-oxo-dGTP pyrophosphatase MutT (NUDIX family)
MTTETTSAAETTAESADVRASGILYRANGRVLLLKRCADSNHGGTWSFPAGKIEDGETPEQAAVRESDEEISHKPEGELKQIHSADGFTLFLCDCDQFIPLLNEESDGYVWAGPDELPEPLHPGVADQIALAGESQAQAQDEQDAHAMDRSAREVDTNGWFEVKNNPLSKVGVFPYRGIQLPNAPDPNAIYQVYRPAEELSNPDCIASFRLLPWINEHVMLGDKAKGLTPAEQKGVQGVIGEEVYFEGSTLFGNIKAFSQSLAQEIDAGKRELSCGYRCVYEWADGSFEGRPYQVIQRRIRGNHLALVESGRMGPEVSVLDGSALDQFTFTVAKDFDMAEETKDGGAPSMSLEDAIKAVSTLLPAIKMITEHAGTPAADPVAPAVGSADANKAESPVSPESDEGATQTPADPAEEDNKSAGMDSAAVFKAVAGQFARRNALASQLSEHIGTFDHSLMSESEVAVYGVKKLGISAPTGQEAAVLTGYLAAKTAPRKEAVSVAQDTAKSANFVTRHLIKKEA